MPLQAASQWDGPAHVFYDDTLYNGFPASDITSRGVRHPSIEHQAKSVAGRGVPADVARHRGVGWLEAGEVITPDELDAAQGVELRPGDVLAVRTPPAPQVPRRRRRRVHGRRTRIGSRVL